MKTSLTGSWQSVRSNIPDYLPGDEWIHFAPDGDRVWEIGQPRGKGKSSLNRVTVKEEKNGYTLFLIQNGIEVGSPVRIENLYVDEIQVIPAHGFVTVFRRSEEPNERTTDKPGRRPSCLS